MNNKNTMGKNAALNGIKTACSILFPFISFSYCSRVLGSNGLGSYSFCQSIIAYLSLIASLGIPSYAIREGAFVRRDNKQLNKFISQVFTINCIMTVFAYLILFLLILLWPKLMGYRYILLILSVQIVLTTLGADWINSIFEDYFYLAIRYILIQLIAIIILIIFVKTPKDLYLYTFISMMSNAGGNILNWKFLKKKGVCLKLTYHLNLKKHFSPIFILFLNSIASIIYLNSDITMLGMYKTDSIVGVYTVSSKIYSMIKSLLTSIIMVTLPRFSSYIAEKREKEYKNTLSTIQDILILFTFPTSVGLFIEADKILNLVAGNEYLIGKNVVRMLAIAIPFATEACFFTYSILVPNRQENKFLISTIIAALLNIGLNIMLMPRYGMNAAAITTLVAEIIVMIITYIYSFKIINFRINRSTLFKTFVGCICVIFVCSIFDKMEFSDNIKLILDIIFGILIYFYVLFLTKCNYVVCIVIKIKDIFMNKQINQL